MKMRIGLFDSGIGGLTVLKELIRKYPNNEYIYFGDTKNVPYGDKSVKSLMELADYNIKFLIDKGVDIIIIACGTISSNCFDLIKEKYNIPIYGIINPTILYLNTTKYKNILVMATKRTIESHIFKKNLNMNVTEIETPELAYLIEKNDINMICRLLDKYLSMYVNKFDALVLGCTHYPIIKEYISKVLPNTDIIDMASYIKIDNGVKFSLEIYFSKVDNELVSNVKRILNNDDVIINMT